MEDISSKKASICTEEKKTKTGIFFKKCVEESFCVNERERRRKEEFHSNTTAAQQEEHIENSPWKEKVEKP